MQMKTCLNTTYQINGGDFFNLCYGTYGVFNLFCDIAGAVYFSTVEYSNIACLNDFSFVYPVGGSSFLQNETVEKLKMMTAWKMRIRYCWSIRSLTIFSGQRAVMLHLWRQQISKKYSMIIR